MKTGVRSCRGNVFSLISIVYFLKNHIIMRSSQIITILKFIRQGKCSCFFYRSMFEQLPELVGIPLDPPVETRVGLVWRRGRYMTAGMRAFLDVCKRRYKDHA